MIVAKIRDRLNQLRVVRQQLQNYDVILEKLPYKPPLTKFERSQFLPVRQKHSLKRSNSCVPQVVTIAPSVAAEKEIIFFSAPQQTIRQHTLSITGDATTTSHGLPGRQSFLLDKFAFENARSLVQCIPNHLRVCIASIAAHLEKISPDILIGKGIEESCVAFWVARILGTPSLVIHCDALAILSTKEDQPFWLKEQLIFFIQHPDVYFIAAEKNSFMLLKDFMKTQFESVIFDTPRCRVITKDVEYTAFLHDIINENISPAPKQVYKAQTKQFEIAVMPDDGWSHDIDKRNSFSYDIINYFLEEGHKVRLVDVYAKDILKQIRGCDGFMWRWSHLDGQYHVAHRILPVIERELKIPVFPDQRSCWHYDDKASQEYLFEAHDIPRPHTWIWYDKANAIRWLNDKATFPLVMKLASGASSTNVILLDTINDAMEWVYIMFDQGVFETEKSNKNILKFFFNMCKEFNYSMKTGFSPVKNDFIYSYHRGYILFQEFLPDNNFDTRVNIIGNRCFPFRRYNRQNDFRASGSGLIDYDQSAIDLRFLHLAFDTAKNLGTQSIAIDGMFRNGEVVVGEISYTYMAAPLHDCGGYWQLHGDPWTGILEFVPHPIWPGRAIAEDFLRSIERGTHDRD